MVNSSYQSILPPQGMSRVQQLASILPISKSTIWKWSKEGKFPTPVKLSPTVTAWRNADVLAWLESQNHKTEQI